jgi:hypothetical protein
MITKSRFVALVCVSLLNLSISTKDWANTVTNNPSQDGSVYFDGVVITSAYVGCTPGDIEGDMVFSVSSITGTVTRALLSVNPYALPLFGTNISVYWFGNTNGLLSGADYDSGTFVGIFTLPSLGFGQPVYFDVTSVFSSVNTPYVGFDLRSDGPDQFSSTAHNYGLPPQLTITTVPEPSTAVLTGAGILAVASCLKKRRFCKFAPGARIRRVS